ncbi:MAG: YcaO-like family protein [Hyphomicrobiaceae bacterium]
MSDERSVPTARTWRACAPTRTLKVFRHAATVAGVTRLIDLTGLDRIGLPVIAAVRPNARSYTIQQGKGMTLADAQASAMMEAIELHTAETAMPDIRVETFAVMQREGCCVDCSLLLRPETSPFHAELPIEWVEARDLRDGTSVWVPFEIVHARYAPPYPAGAGSFVRSTTGLASGNTFLEAVIHGICEVVERDAMSLWSLLTPPARQLTRIDLSSLTDDDLSDCVDRIAASGLSLVLSDMTSNLGIAAVHAAILDANFGNRSLEFSGNGSGCHLRRELAGRRAITEAAQSRLTLITGARDNLDDGDFELNERAALTAVAMAERTCRSFADLPSYTDPAHSAMLGHLLDRLTGYRVLVVNLTIPEVGVPVVRVVIPGLEDGIDTPGYVPGPRARLRAFAAILDRVS